MSLLEKHLKYSNLLPTDEYLLRNGPKFSGEWNYMCIDEEIDENFSSLLSSYLKSSSCNSESKVIFLEEFSKYIENEIKALEVKIQSQDSHYQSLSFQNPFQLSFDIKIENKDKFDDPKLKQWYGRNLR